MTKKPEVQCYLCRRIFQKEVRGAAVNRNFYRCRECLDNLRAEDAAVRETQLTFR